MILVGALAVVGSILFVARPVAAAATTYVDPRPCSPAVDGGGCISQVGTAYETGTVTLTMTVGLATSPVTDPAWFPGQPQAYVEWLIVPSNDPTTVYYAKATDLGSGQLSGWVTESGVTNAGCLPLSGVVDPSFNLSANLYSLTFPSACIGNTPSFMVSALYSANGGPLPPAASPATGFCCTVTESTTPPTAAPTTAPTPSPSGSEGYDVAAADGGVFSFGTAQYDGSMGGTHLHASVVGLAGDIRTGGYWEVASDGGVFSFDAPFYGSMGGTPLDAPIVGMVSDNLTGGYWMVAADGGVFAFNAPFYGSMGGSQLDEPIVGMAAMPFGTGYWLVAKDGGVFAFGDAPFSGSMGASSLDAPVVGMAADFATGGYWLVASDGAVFSFNAPFYGSMGGSALDAPIVGMATGPGAGAGAGGYWFVGSDGGVFNFGDTEFDGSMGGSALDAPVVGMTTAF